MKNFARLTITSLFVLSSLLCLNCVCEEDDWQLSGSKGKGEGNTEEQFYTYQELEELDCSTLSAADQEKAAKGACSEEGDLISCEETPDGWIKTPPISCGDNKCIAVPEEVLKADSKDQAITIINELSTLKNLRMSCVHSDIAKALKDKKAEMEKDSEETPISERPDSSDETQTTPDENQNTSTNACVPELKDPSGATMKDGVALVAADTVQLAWSTNCKVAPGGYSVELYKGNEKIYQVWTKSANTTVDLANSQSTPYPLVPKNLKVGDEIQWTIRPCEHAQCDIDNALGSASKKFKWILATPVPINSNGFNWFKKCSTTDKCSYSILWQAVLQTNAIGYQITITEWNPYTTNPKVYVDKGFVAKPNTQFTLPDSVTMNVGRYLWKIRSCTDSNCTGASDWSSNQQVIIQE